MLNITITIYMDELKVSKSFALSAYKQFHRDCLEFSKQIIKKTVKNAMLGEKYGWILFMQGDVESFIKEQKLFFAHVDIFLKMMEKDGCFKVAKIREIEDEKFSYIFSHVNLKQIEKYISKFETDMPEEIVTKKDKGVATIKPYVIKIGDKFFYCGKWLVFGEKTMYQDVFDIIYKCSSQDGFVSYQKINDDLLKRKWEKVPHKEINKRIQNSVNNGIFRFAKMGGQRFINKLPDGRKLIRVIRKRGMEFNNYPL